MFWNTGLSFNLRYMQLLLGAISSSQTTCVDFGDKPSLTDNTKMGSWYCNNQSIQDFFSVPSHIITDAMLNRLYNWPNSKKSISQPIKENRLKLVSLRLIKDRPFKNWTSTKETSLSFFLSAFANLSSIISFLQNAINHPLCS